MNTYIEYIKNNNLGEFYCHKSFKELTTLKIGGKISLLFYPNSNESLILFYKYYLKEKKYPLFIIGNGSNIFASSKNYQGIVICLKRIKQNVKVDNNIVTVTSGILITSLINKLKKINIGGIEKLSYIPATIGGMIKMNASAYNCNLTDYLLNVKCINEYGDVVIYNKKDLLFSYRKSNIKDNEIICECSLCLDYVDEETINKTMIKIRKDRLFKQPLEYYNAGSTFKNTKCHAWKLIDSAGLRGLTINDAMVSEKHCNFLINKGKCDSDDMLLLINKIINKVKNVFDYNLECEWIFINF